MSIEDVYNDWYVQKSEVSQLRSQLEAQQKQIDDLKGFIQSLTQCDSFVDVCRKIWEKFQ